MRPKDLAYSFQCEEGHDIGLNGRLPRIAQRDVLSSGRFEQFISRTKRQTTRLVVRGSRLFNKKFCGRSHAEKNMREIPWVRSKAAPLQSSFLRVLRLRFVV